MNTDPISEAAKPRRDQAVDVIKGLSIIGVVWIHAALPRSGMFRFGVPAFIGLWAFHLERSLIREGARSQAITRRVRTLLVPYMFWTALYLSLNYSLLDLRAMPPHTLIGGLLGGFGWAGQYYFVILFQLLLLYPAIRAALTTKNHRILISLCITFDAIAAYTLSSNLIITNIGHRIFIYWLPYVFLGIALARGYITPNRRLIVPAIGLLALAPHELDRLNEFAVYISPTISLASALILSSVAPAVQTQPSTTHAQRSGIWESNIIGTLSNALQLLGRNTFAIFVSNVLFLSIAKSLYGTAINPWLAATFALVSGLALAFVLRRSGLGILVGEK